MDGVFPVVERVIPTTLSSSLRRVYVGLCTEEIGFINGQRATYSRLDSACWSLGKMVDEASGESIK